MNEGRHRQYKSEAKLEVRERGVVWNEWARESSELLQLWVGLRVCCCSTLKVFDVFDVPRNTISIVLVLCFTREEEEKKRKQTKDKQHPTHHASSQLLLLMQ